VESKIFRQPYLAIERVVVWLKEVSLIQMGLAQFPSVSLLETNTYRWKKLQYSYFLDKEEDSLRSNWGGEKVNSGRKNKV
jgi:hypothetical protein